MYYQIDRENKTIPITLEAIPKNWANISNMDCLSNEELASLGYVKGTPPETTPAFASDKQCLRLRAEVQEVQTRRPLTTTSGSTS